MQQRQKLSRSMQIEEADTKLEAQAIYRAMTEKLDAIDAMVKELLMEAYAPEYTPSDLQDQLGWFMTSVKTFRKDLKKLFLNPEFDSGFMALTAYSALDSQLLLTDMNDPGNPDDGNDLSPFIDKLVKYTKSLGTELYQLISKLLKVKEWSIIGGIGQNLFGLSGTISLGVTFEK